jgi:hypothetical protein
MRSYHVRKCYVLISKHNHIAAMIRNLFERGSKLILVLWKE